MYCKLVTIAYLWCFTIFGAFYAEEISLKTIAKGCSLHTLDFSQCGLHETCVSAGAADGTGTCQCRWDSQSDSGICRDSAALPPPAPNMAHPSHGLKLVLWSVGSMVLMAAAVAGILYTGRQKAWLSRLYRLRVRSYNNVLSSRPV